MDIVYLIVIVLFLLLVFWGIKDWINVFFVLWHENGVLFTLLTILLLIFFILPSILKDYAPQYYGLSIWLLIL
jgi:hypothetical protein